MASSFVQKVDLIEMFNGDTLTIPFEFYRTPTDPIDLLEMNAKVLWTLCPYGQVDYPVLSKPMVISETEPYLATVYLTIEDTKNLNDSTKYTHQPIVIYTNMDGTREYRRAQGDVLMWPRIKHELIENK